MPQILKGGLATLINRGLTTTIHSDLIGPKMKREAIQRLVKDLGGPAKLARHLAACTPDGKPLSTAAVSKWTRIPPQYCMTLAEMSGWKYRPSEMRPDVFGAVETREAA